jgi:flagellar basal body-associated protein FliL
MTSQTNSRSGFTFALTVAVMVMLAVAVAGSVWAKGNGQQAAMATEATRIDVATLMTSADIANLPVLHIEDPI